MSLKQAVLIAIIGRVIGLAYWTILDLGIIEFNLNLSMLMTWSANGTFLIFLGVLYSKQR